MRVLQDILKELPKVKQRGSFVQNVSIVFSGNVLNFFLQLIFAPIISRIYGPEAYGEYAYYNLFITNVGFLASMSIPSVYVLPKTKLEYLALCKIVIVSISALTLISVILFILLNKLVFKIEISYLAVPLVILLVFLKNIQACLSSWNVREKKFKRNTSSEIFASFSSKLSTIGFGLLFFPNGLVLMLGDLVRSIQLLFTQTSLKVIRVLLRFLSKHNTELVKNSFRANINVPKFIFPSQLLNKLSMDLPIIAVGAYFDIRLVGAYTFAVTLLNIPVTLFENSIRPVIYQKANEVYQTGKDALAQLFLKSFRSTIFLSLAPTTILAVFCPIIFPFVFGSEWIDAGYVAMLLSIKFIATAVLAPYTGFWRIMKREKQLFKLNSISLFFRNAPLLIPLLGLNFYFFIFLYGIISSFGVLLNLSDLILYLFQRKTALRLIVSTLMGIGICFVIVVIASLHYNIL